MVNNTFTLYLRNRSFPSFPGPLFQNEGRFLAFDMKIIFHSHANKTHFHKKGCVPSFILKVRVLELGSGLFINVKTHDHCLILSKHFAGE